MLKAVASGFLILSFLVFVSEADGGFIQCNCDGDERYWSMERILTYQRISDFLIAVAYFSIPIEIIYFVSCSNFPYKRSLFQMGAFIVLCGLTHFLNFLASSGQPALHLVHAIVVSKFLTAVVSVFTACTLPSDIPLLLKVKVRESMLKKKASDLVREVGIIKKKKEAGMHVRMLTQEIRKSLDRHTILYTTLVELSNILDLQNCAIWMPNENNTEMNLTHELTERNFSSIYNMPIPISDSDVKEIKGSDAVKILDAYSSLAAASSGGSCEPGAVAAIRMPLLRLSNFKGGTPEIAPQSYPILVLVLPSGNGRSWSNQEIEIVRVVADQVAVALSHAAVLEESQHMRDALMEQNQALHQAKQDALCANQARNAFQSVMSHGLRRPMHSISGLLSMLQDDKLSNEQQLLVDTMVKTSKVVTTIMDEVMDTSEKDHSGRFPLVMRHFHLHSMIREAACLVKCLCTFMGCNIGTEVDRSLPNHVMGDERRVFQVILHMVGNHLKCNGGGYLTFRVLLENDISWKTRRSNSSSNDNIYIRFEICTSIKRPHPEGITSSLPHCTQRYCSNEVEESLNFNVCRKLVQLMQGDIWRVPNPEGSDKSIAVVLGFQILPSSAIGKPEYRESADQSYLQSLLHGVRVLLADSDDVNRAVTRKMLEKLGCIVAVVSSGYDCLGALWRCCVLVPNCSFGSSPA